MRNLTIIALMFDFLRLDNNSDGETKLRGKNDRFAVLNFKPSTLFVVHTTSSQERASANCSRNLKMTRPKYYAVRKGRNRGVFSIWNEAEKQASLAVM